MGESLTGLIAEHAEELCRSLQALLTEKAFKNRYTLHPRRLGELATELVEQFQEFLRERDSRKTVQYGGKLAQEGLGQSPLCAIGALLRSAYTVEETAARELVELVSLVDEFVSALLEGYIGAREEQILMDQQQLRLALSTALERQRRELHIKNHAIHTSINGIVLCSLEGDITYANPAVLRMWGYAGADALMGSPCAELLGGEGGFILKTIREKGSWQGELSVARLDGVPFEVAVSASAILGESNEPAGIIAFFYDVTERKRLEGQFRQAQKMDALGQLAGGIVHDFNNLLTAISGYTQLALMDVPKESKLYEDFLQIKTATDRGKELTQELRLFTRQTSSKRELLNPNPVVDETYKLLLRTFPPEVKINLSLDPEISPVRANPSQMSQMIMNLCMNARDAILSATEGSRESSAQARGQLTLRTFDTELEWHTAALYLNARPGRYACIAVEDTGVGIPADHMERLFEPFFTTKGSQGGTGLGLAVVFGIVQNHEGFIDVQSKEGQGSTFTVYLPVAEEGSESEAQKPADTYAPDLTAGKGTILVVEDNAQVQGMMIRALRESGYRVHGARNGVEAIAAYKEQGKRVDLVVLDMIMPQMGGRECFYRLKKLNPRVKVLIITGFTTDGSLEDFLEEGARGIITKPFELHAFTETVQRLIAEK
jgi:two-component system cell cycle sensor histidine kinase/response regulator CckA